MRPGPVAVRFPRVRRALTALLLAVLLACLPLTAPARAQDPCANRKTGAPAREPGRPRPPLLIGDSGALLAVAPLARLGIETDARGCRPLRDAVAIMAARARAGTLPRVVVLDVGANGGIELALLRRALRIVGADGRLALVTPATTYAATSAMRLFHARHPTRTVLVDWAASGLAGRYGGDGIHIGYEGEAALARFVARQVHPYTPPRASIPFGARAKDCGEVHPGGRVRQVLVLRGRDRVLCSVARSLATARDKTSSPYFRWFDWRFLGKPPFKDVFVRNDGKVVIAVRTPSAPAPDPGTDPPAR
ncbi:MAG: yrhL [Solirubrobacterales bacterium]|nr:yrhL [Solirubrobacterales bacterium]